MAIDYTTTNKKIIIRGSDDKMHRDSKWIEMEKSAFTLKAAIEIFDVKI